MKLKYDYNFVKKDSGVECHLRFKTTKENYSNLMKVAELDFSRLGSSKNYLLDLDIDLIFSNTYVGIAKLKKNDIYDYETAKRIAYEKARRKAYKALSSLMRRIFNKLANDALSIDNAAENFEFKAKKSEGNILNEIKCQKENKFPGFSLGYIGMTDRGEWFKVWDFNGELKLIYETGAWDSLISFDNFGKGKFYEVIFIDKGSLTFKDAKQKLKVEIGSNRFGLDPMTWFRYKDRAYYENKMNAFDN